MELTSDQTSLPAEIHPAGRCSRGHQLETSGLCLKCIRCQQCDGLLSQGERDWNTQQARHNTEWQSVHPRCFTDREKAILASETVTIPKSLFDKLNALRLCIEPDPDLSLETNVAIHDYSTQRYLFQYVKDDDLLLWVKCLESACTTVAMSLGKNRRAQEIKHNERDREKFKEAQTAREAPKAPKAAATAQNVKLTKEEKQIEKFMDLTGMSRDEVIAKFMKKAQVPSA